MASALAYFTLPVLCTMGLCLALLDLPVPRVELGIATGVLTFSEAMALKEADQPRFYDRPDSGGIHNTGELIGALVVPPLTALVLTLLVLYLLQARRETIARVTGSGPASSRRTSGSAGS